MVLVRRKLRRVREEQDRARCSAAPSHLPQADARLMTVFDIEVAKRFKDLDPYDHVSNATFLDYVMEARVRVYRSLGMYDRGVVGQVVVRQEINYLRPIRFSIEPLMTRTWFSHIGTSSFTMETQLIDEGQLAADAKSVMVCFDKDSSTSRPIPPEFRLLIEEHLEN
ncbi:MAG: acyl-CoA thioesterase [Actinobacteria bacterium]|nr:acyl-CoA thioesterase [Actinomycetota bacterium]